MPPASPDTRAARLGGGRPGANAGQRRAPVVLNPDEVSRLCAAFPGGRLGKRNRALVAVLYRAGLRLNEALKLSVSDVDFDGGTIEVRLGKGSKGTGPKQRTVAIDAAGLDAISRWLHVRRKNNVPDAAPLLCGLDGTPWAPQAVRRVLTRAAERAEISKHVHPHALRHSHAVALDKSKARVTAISKQLGHSSLAVTSVYLNHLTTDDIKEAVNGAAFDPEPAA